MEMLEEELLALLRRGDGPRSGEEMSRTLGVSRAMVWKGIQALREKGYVIASAPRRGYELEEEPDLLEPGRFVRADGAPVLCLDAVDSTNTECKRRALMGAPDGLAVLADTQTGGRGRRGRGFVSPPGGLYLSLLLRPAVTPEQSAPITAWAAVAAALAVEDVTGLSPGIKWPNDLVLSGKKLCGILTELSVEGETGSLEYLVIGLGINLRQRAEDWGELSDRAVSLAQLLPEPPRRDVMAAALLARLDYLRRDFPKNAAPYLDYYRQSCVNLGREQQVLEGDRSFTAFCQGVDDDFSLRLRLPDGTQRRLISGEVSLRGVEGYI